MFREKTMKFIKTILITLMFTFSFSAIYDVGETVSDSHQNLGFDICFGDYPSDQFRLADLNGDLNGGDYQVMFINMAASW